MCNWLALEVCCAESKHDFPFTLKACAAMILCEETDLIRKFEQTDGHMPSRSPLHYGYECPDFDPMYARCERIYWTKCDDCCRDSAAADNFNERDILIALDFNLLLRKELAKALHRRPYRELVRVFPTEFGIARRFMLTGSRWTEAPQPTETDALGPNPPLELDLDGLQWYYDRGMGGEVDKEIWRIVCAMNYPLDLPVQSILNWIDWLPPNPDQFSVVDNRSISNVSAATSWQDRISISSTFPIHNYRTWEEYYASYDWYPSSESEKGDSD
ncbi:hypothetical protein F4781DRAFT_439415 [Annulohypoxylon bovei var. microspora]|nr:hypothetical protein F4781DRAFT_439415 [Annulohypoxylon bovei var. microspora]